ncbi:MAG: FkbM family methyltransferase [Proteobacteria bacterium]|nr:FkbM family methyltransferase [Pseudomonadota bacterium]
MQYIQGTICSNFISGQPISFFVINPNDAIQRHHLSGEFYECEELGIIERHFRKGGVFVDIGANVGNHSIFVGLFLSPLAVLPVEPNPAAIPCLRTNLLLNNMIGLVDQTMIGIGFSDNIENVDPLTANVNNIGGTKMLNSGDNGSITLFPGDMFLAERAIDFIKIDVEAMEMRVLAGLNTTILRSRPNIFVEVDDCNVADFYDWLKTHKYSVAERFRRYIGNENYMVVPL